MMRIQSTQDNSELRIDCMYQIYRYSDTLFGGQGAECEDRQRYTRFDPIATWKLESRKI